MPASDHPDRTATVQAKPAAAPSAMDERRSAPTTEPAKPQPEMEEDLHIPGYGHGV